MTEIPNEHINFYTFSLSRLMFLKIISAAFSELFGSHRSRTYQKYLIEMFENHQTLEI